MRGERPDNMGKSRHGWNQKKESGTVKKSREGDGSLNSRRHKK